MEETRNKVEQDFEDMNDVIRSMKRHIQDELEREQALDSDEEQKKYMKDYDQKLTYINKVDRDQYHEANPNANTNGNVVQKNHKRKDSNATEATDAD